MVQGYPQSTATCCVAASRAKDKGRPTLSSVPTLRHLPYMPFRKHNKVRMRVQRISRLLCTRYTLLTMRISLFLSPFPRPFIPPPWESSFDDYALRHSKFRSNGLSKRQPARASRYSTGRKTFGTLTASDNKAAAKFISRLMSRPIILRNHRWRCISMEKNRFFFLFFFYFFARKRLVASWLGFLLRPLLKDVIILTRRMHFSCTHLGLTLRKERSACPIIGRRGALARTKGLAGSWVSE